jgi:hypothetical protein
MKNETVPGDINQVFKIALEALERASLSARQQAMVCKTDLIIWRNNKVIRLSPAEIREESAEYQIAKGSE